MKLRITWDYPALARFYELLPNEAMAVDRAVIHFAETGRGNVAQDGAHYRLSTGVHRVRFTVDRRERTMHVLYVYRILDRDQ